MVALAVALFAVIRPASAAPAIVLDDNDNLVKSGTFVVAQLKDGESVISATWTVEVGLLVAGGTLAEIEGDNPPVPVDRATASVSEAARISTKAAANGEYEIIATDGDGTDYKTTLEVGDPGTNIGSIELSLGRVGHSASTSKATDGSTTSARATSTSDATTDNAPGSYEDCAEDMDDATDIVTVEGETGDLVLDGCIAVTVTVKNSLGELAQADGVVGIDVYAPLAVIIVDAAVSPESADRAADGSAEVAGAANSAKFFIARESAGTVEVSAFVRGKDGFIGTKTPLTLTFTGAASSIKVGEPSSPLSQSGIPYKAKDTDCGNDSEGTAITVCDMRPSRGVANIKVMATDKSDNPAPVPALNVEVKNSDGVVVSGDSASTAKIRYAFIDDGLTRTVELTGNEAAPGAYSVTISQGTQKETVDIVVAGDAASIELSIDGETVSIGDTIIVSATVTDKDGNLQPDAGTVSFHTSGALKLEALDDENMDMGGAQRSLNDGTASVEYWVSDGSGKASIIARTDNVRSEVLTVNTVVAEPAEAMPEEVDLGCFSAYNAFATYKCDQDSSASELFALVSGRGATALHLWNGSAWVRYSVVDGAMVPGSTDFPVSTSETLYISY